MKNVTMLRDWSPDVWVNDIQFVRWCIDSFYKLTIILMHVLYFVYTVVSYVSCLVFFLNIWGDILLSCFFCLIKYFLSDLDFFSVMT